MNNYSKNSILGADYFVLFSLCMRACGRKSLMCSALGVLGLSPKKLSYRFDLLVVFFISTFVWPDKTGALKH